MGKSITGRCFEVVTQITATTEKEKKDRIKKAIDILKKYKSIERYSIVIHDKDYLTKDEIIEEYYSDKETLTKEDKMAITKAWAEKKYKRPTHIHIVFETPRNAFKPENVGKWFGVAPNFVRIKKGYGALLDATQYLTHEDDKQQDLGKYRYPDNEIISNWGWRAELDARAEERAKYGKNLSDRERLQLDVLYNGLTLKQAREKDPYNYNKDLNILKRNRGDYLSNQTPPAFRLNLYICGKGGVGKDLMAEALARSMYPQFLADDEIFFNVGASGAEFEGYDGQPVLIWSDARAGELVQRWGRENLLAGILDPFPTVTKRQNIKYSSVSLMNSINIFTGADKWVTFLNGLVGEYKDKNGRLYESENKAQSYRRFPLIIPVYQDQFNILLNQGFLYDNKSWEQYNCYQNIRGSFAMLADKLSSMPEIKETKTKALVEPVREQTEKLYNKGIGSVKNDEEIDLSIFDNYGEIIEQSDFERGLAALNEEELFNLLGDKKNEYSKMPFEDSTLDSIKAIEREIFKRQRG